MDINIGILNKTPKNNFLLFNNENAQIITLIDAIAPNSCNVLLFVSVNAAKPDAVVTFVSNVIFPIL